jgi:hypothetical protein
VGQLWDKDLIGVRIQTDDVNHNVKKMAVQTLEIARFMPCVTDRNLFTNSFDV